MGRLAARLNNNVLASTYSPCCTRACPTAADNVTHPPPRNPPPITSPLDPNHHPFGPQSPPEAPLPPCKESDMGSFPS